MDSLVGRKPSDPQHLVHYINYLIDRDKLEEASRLLVELKGIDSTGLDCPLELEARVT